MKLGQTETLQANKCFSSERDSVREFFPHRLWEILLT